MGLAMLCSLASLNSYWWQAGSQAASLWTYRVTVMGVFTQDFKWNKVCGSGNFLVKNLANVRTVCKNLTYTKLSIFAAVGFALISAVFTMCMACRKQQRKSLSALSIQAFLDFFATCAGGFAAFCALQVLNEIPIKGYGFGIYLAGATACFSAVSFVITLVSVCFRAEEDRRREAQDEERKCPAEKDNDMMVDSSAQNQAASINSSVKGSVQGAARRQPPSSDVIAAEAPLKEAQAATFSAMDKNNDGIITKEEFGLSGQNGQQDMGHFQYQQHQWGFNNQPGRLQVQGAGPTVVLSPRDIALSPRNLSPRDINLSPRNHVVTGFGMTVQQQAGYGVAVQQQAVEVQQVQLQLNSAQVQSMIPQSSPANQMKAQWRENRRTSAKDAGGVGAAAAAAGGGSGSAPPPMRYGNKKSMARE